MKVQELIQKISEIYSADDILDLLDNEINEWDYGYDDDEIEEYPSRWDFYQEFNNKEAEDVVVNTILNKIDLSTNDLFDIDEGLSLQLFLDWLEEYTSHNFSS